MKCTDLHTSTPSGVLKKENPWGPIETISSPKTQFDEQFARKAPRRVFVVHFVVEDSQCFKRGFFSRKIYLISRETRTCFVTSLMIYYK